MIKQARPASYLETRIAWIGRSVDHLLPDQPLRDLKGGLVFGDEHLLDDLMVSMGLAEELP